MAVQNQEKEPAIVISLPVEGSPYTVTVRAMESRMPSSGGDLLVHDYQLELVAGKAAIGQFLKNVGELTERESLTHASGKSHITTISGDPDRLDGELSLATDYLNRGKIFRDGAQTKLVFDTLYQAIEKDMGQTPGYLEPVSSATPFRR